MRVVKTPEWVNNIQLSFSGVREISNKQFDSINANLDKILSTEPLVSVIIIAWNEELNILRCIASLSNIKSCHPFEIIVVNNNSSDNTQKTLDRLSVRSFFEPEQGCGPARQLGQEMARGKYILTGDADCLYPENWIDEMMKILQKPGVVCVYGRYSFISSRGFPRWKLFLFETLKDAISEFRHINRPYFNAYGLSMGYIKEYGLLVGYITINRRGEDGQLCMDLMKYGKIKQVKSGKARIWTGTRTIQEDGSMFLAIKSRLIKEVKRFSFNLHSRFPDKQKMSD